MEPLLSVVIVSWNTRDLLVQCLESLYQGFAQGFAHHLPGGNHEVFVVDNASTDGSPAEVRRRFPDVRLIELPENEGFARANNRALERACGKYILVLNPDTLIRPGALDRLVAFMDAHPAAGAAGPRVLNPDGTLQVSCYPFPTLAREAWRLFHLDSLRVFGVYAQSTWDPTAVRPVDALLGACQILRRSALDQVGFFDPGYFMYTEEIDLCYRIKRAAWQIIWVPEAEIIHYGGQSTRQAAPRMFLSLYRTKIQFFRKHYGRFQALGYKAVLFAAAAARVISYPFAWALHSRQERQEANNLTRRYLDLIVQLPGM